MTRSRFLSRLFRDRWHLQQQLRDRPRWWTSHRRLYLEPLEDRVLPSLLGLAQQGVAPDIASDVLTNLSYTQLGTNANPFHYDATPLEITLGDGSMFAINNPSSGGSAKTTLNLLLDNSGKFASGTSADDLPTRYVRCAHRERRKTVPMSRKWSLRATASHPAPGTC